MDDPAYRSELTRLEISMTTFSSFEKRIFSAVASGQHVGTISSALKIRRAEIKQQLTHCVATAAPRYLNDRAATIYAGSNEVQRNIIAKATLGL